MSIYFARFLISILILYSTSSQAQILSIREVEETINKLSAKQLPVPRTERLNLAWRAAGTKNPPRTYGQRDHLGSAPDIFRAFWDVPGNCHTYHGIEIPFGDFGIEFNSNYDWHHGNAYHVFADELGYLPFIQRENGKFVHGGLPQVITKSNFLAGRTRLLLV